MPDSDRPNNSLLDKLGPRYPEKTFYLGQVFNDTTNSYKFLWFLALLSLTRKAGNRLPMSDLLTEMAAIAWHPVCLYRLSLGRQDTLQTQILEIQLQSGLKPDAKPEMIRRFVEESKEATAALNYFKRHVPTRFLTPWFREKLRGIPDEKRDVLIEQLARQSQRTPFASPYWFHGGSIRLNESWRTFLAENMAIVKAFAEHHLTLYLQARNPNVPGVVNKLRAPTEPQLTAARDFWKFVRSDFEKAGKPAAFRDIYSERPLTADFSIDHFLPWSFVAHDLLWNLTPVEPETNSSKSDVLPDLDTYLPRLANIHFAAIGAAKKRPNLLEDYTDCFKLDVRDLLSLSQEDLKQKYREVIMPQAQIAQNLGFQPGWKMLAPTIVLSKPRRVVGERVPDVVRRRARDTISRTVIIERFRTKSVHNPPADYLPFYPLALAAGRFLAGYETEPEGWVDPLRYGFSKRLSKGMFVTQVLGKSMEPTIKDGSFCVFRHPVEGTRQGRVVLVQKRDFTDPETGGGYTVKRYHSTKSTNDDGWRHETIELVPDNPDRVKFPVLKFTSEDDADLQTPAEFIEMLSPPT